MRLIVNFLFVCCLYNSLAPQRGVFAELSLDNSLSKTTGFPPALGNGSPFPKSASFFQDEIEGIPKKINAESDDSSAALEGKDDAREIISYEQGDGRTLLRWMPTLNIITYFNKLPYLIFGVGILPFILPGLLFLSLLVFKFLAGAATATLAGPIIGTVIVIIKVASVVFGFLLVRALKYAKQNFTFGIIPFDFTAADSLQDYYEIFAP